MVIFFFDYIIQQITYVLLYNYCDFDVTNNLSIIMVDIYNHIFD